MCVDAVNSGLQVLHGELSARDEEHFVLEGKSDTLL